MRFISPRLTKTRPRPPSHASGHLLGSLAYKCKIGTECVHRLGIETPGLVIEGRPSVARWPCTGGNLLSRSFMTFLLQRAQCSVRYSARSEESVFCIVTKYKVPCAGTAWKEAQNTEKENLEGDCSAKPRGPALAFVSRLDGARTAQGISRRRAEQINLPMLQHRRVAWKLCFMSAQKGICTNRKIEIQRRKSIHGRSGSPRHGTCGFAEIRRCLASCRNKVLERPASPPGRLMRYCTLGPWDPAHPAQATVVANERASRSPPTIRSSIFLQRSPLSP
jgi:hypothetical protein